MYHQPGGSAPPMRTRFVGTRPAPSCAAGSVTSSPSSQCHIDDLVQESMVRLLRAVRREPVENIEALMTEIARRTAIDCLRRRTRWSALVRPEEPDLEQVSEPEGARRRAGGSARAPPLRGDRVLHGARVTLPRPGRRLLRGAGLEGGCQRARQEPRRDPEAMVAVPRDAARGGAARQGVLKDWSDQ